ASNRIPAARVDGSRSTRDRPSVRTARHIGEHGGARDSARDGEHGGGHAGEPGSEPGNGHTNRAPQLIRQQSNGSDKR
ncbi:hypothetical protein, partial [Streptomyces celluloflavus]|uniref:hypothetical protein n=1 Tax=Streptomyces celluloflavus TaxID=58344 RepID=UPI00368E3944